MAGSRELALLHCVSSYPAPAADSNLQTIPHLARTFDVVAGLSDHTLGTAVPLAAVALNAAIIEKHFTLSRADGGPDAAFSLEPLELQSLCDGCRSAWEAVGQVSYGPTRSERGSMIFRRSLYVVRDVSKGDPFTADNVRSIRPGYGLPPKHFRDFLDRPAARDIKRGEPLSWDMVKSSSGTENDQSLT